MPVSHEEVRVEREPITDANRGDAYDGPAISEEEHEVTLHAERPVVDTEAVPVERVRLGTETVADRDRRPARCARRRSRSTTTSAASDADRADLRGPGPRAGPVLRGPGLTCRWPGRGRDRPAGLRVVARFGPRVGQNPEGVGFAVTMRVHAARASRGTWSGGRADPFALRVLHDHGERVVLFAGESMVLVVTTVVRAAELLACPVDELVRAGRHGMPSGSEAQRRPSPRSTRAGRRRTRRAQTRRAQTRPAPALRPHRFGSTSPAHPISLAARRHPERHRPVTRSLPAVASFTPR